MMFSYLYFVIYFSSCLVVQLAVLIILERTYFSKYNNVHPQFEKLSLETKQKNVLHFGYTHFIEYFLNIVNVLISFQKSYVVIVSLNKTD